MPVKRKQILTPLQPRKKMIIQQYQSFHNIIDVFIFPISLTQVNIIMADICIFPTSLNLLKSLNFFTSVYEKGSQITDL